MKSAGIFWMAFVGGVVFCFLLACSSSQEREIEVMTYNIRVDFPDTSLNGWDRRKSSLAHLIRYYSPDILGTQEGMKHQLDYILEETEDYAYSGVGRDDGAKAGEYCAIFYRKELFNLLDEGSFWLSTTPDSVSKGWDAALPRICSFVLLELKNTGIEFWVFNTHFDHVGREARTNSVQLILEVIDSLNTEPKLPLILMGDFNLTPGEEPVRLLSEELHDSWNISKIPAYGPVGTYNGFDLKNTPSRRIDYIFVNEKIESVLSYGTIDEFMDFRYPSDHLPVLIKINLTKK